MLTKQDIELLIHDFLEVAAKSGAPLRRSDIFYGILGCPHESPVELPAGKVAVYVFEHGPECLKVGKVGPNSEQRYRYHHYNPASSPSNLANALVSDSEMSASHNLNPSNIKSWMKANTYRVNFLLDAKLGMPVLNLLEAFLQCRFRPRYEGFENQA